jgi:hypothetical protein
MVDATSPAETRRTLPAVAAVFVVYMALIALGVAAFAVVGIAGY